MPVLIAVWLLVAAIAILIAAKLSLPAALAAWAVAAAVLCAIGALLLQMQPVGVSTPGGRVGSGVVYWGFGVGRGQLVPAAVISWVVWLVIGSGIVAATHFRAQPRYLGMVLAWTVDALALLYVLGILEMGRLQGAMPVSMIGVALVLVVMLAGSATLWGLGGSESARSAALALAAGPTLFIGLGYALFLAVTVLFGRHARF